MGADPSALARASGSALSACRCQLVRDAFTADAPDASASLAVLGNCSCSCPAFCCSGRPAGVMKVPKPHFLARFFAFKRGKWNKSLHDRRGRRATRLARLGEHSGLGGAEVYKRGRAAEQLQAVQAAPQRVCSWEWWRCWTSGSSKSGRIRRGGFGARRPLLAAKQPPFLLPGTRATTPREQRRGCSCPACQIQGECTSVLLGKRLDSTASASSSCASGTGSDRPFSEASCCNECDACTRACGSTGGA